MSIDIEIGCKQAPWKYDNKRSKIRIICIYPWLKIN